MTGYKAFNNDLICMGFQYEVGQIYEMDSEPVCCQNGFHFCKDLEECFKYYNFGSRVCVVEALGDLDSDDNEKYCTNKIKIVRELSFEEICNIIGIEVSLANNLIKSFELTKEFFGYKVSFFGGYWVGIFCWYVINCVGRCSCNVVARLTRDFKRIEFFRLKNLNKVLFECDNEKIYQVGKLENEDLKLFEYLKENLEF